MKARLIFMLSALTFVGSVFGQNTPTKKVAILETVDKENAVPYGVKLMVRSKLAYAITNTPGYEGYDRVDIASIMNEQEFQRTGLVNDTQIRKLGEMTGASEILVAEVAQVDNNHIFITAKILNVESAKLERTDNIQTSTHSEDIERDCRVLAAKLFGLAVTTPPDNDASSQTVQSVQAVQLLQTLLPNLENNTDEEKEIRLYLPAGFKASKKNGKLALNITVDGRFIGEGTISSGFDFKVTVTSGVHQVRIGNSITFVDATKYQYFEFLLKEQSFGFGVKLYNVYLKESR